MELRARLWLGAGLGTGVALLAGRRSGHGIGAALAGAAAGLLLAASAGRPQPRRRRIQLAAPLDRVFETLTDYARLPHFMAHVRRVEALDEGRWRWVVQPPGSAPLEWVAVVTRHEPNALVAWEGAVGAALPQRGVLRFRPVNGGTLLEMEWEGADPALACLMQDVAAARRYLEAGRLLPREPGA